MVRMSGAPPAPCSRARRLRQRARKHQPPRPPSRPSSPRRAHTTARSPVRATIRYSSRPPDRRPVPARRTRGGHVTARRATTIQATTAERGTATQDIPPAGTGRTSHYQSRSSRGRAPAQSLHPILPRLTPTPAIPDHPARGFPRRRGRDMLQPSIQRRINIHIFLDPANDPGKDEPTMTTDSATAGPAATGASPAGAVPGPFPPPSRPAPEPEAPLGPSPAPSRLDGAGRRGRLGGPDGGHPRLPGGRGRPPAGTAISNQRESVVV